MSETYVEEQLNPVPTFPKQESFYPSLRTRVHELVASTSNGRFASTGTLLKCTLLGVGALTAYVALLTAGDAPFRAIIAGAAYAMFALLLGFSAGHDASHYCLVRKRWLNRAIQRVVFTLVGVDAYLWRFRHTKSHHIMPNVNGSDIDIDENPFFRLSPNQPFRRHFRFQHLYAPFVYPLVLLHTVYWQDFVYLGKRELANVRGIHFSRMVAVGCVLTKFTHITISVMIPWLLLPYALWQVLAAYLLISFVVSMFFTFSLIGTHFSDLVEFPEPDREGVLPTGWAEHALSTSCDWSPTSPFANAVMGGLNAHAVHHLFPSVAHSHNTRIAKELLRLDQAGAIHYRHVTLPKMIHSHFRLLRSLGKPASGMPAGGAG